MSFVNTGCEGLLVTHQLVICPVSGCLVVFTAVCPGLLQWGILLMVFTDSSSRNVRCFINNTRSCTELYVEM